MIYAALRLEMCCC